LHIGQRNLFKPIKLKKKKTKRDDYNTIFPKFCSKMGILFQLQHLSHSTASPSLKFDFFPFHPGLILFFSHSNLSFSLKFDFFLFHHDLQILKIRQIFLFLMKGLKNFHFFLPAASELSCLPKQLAWILATRKVFMYPGSWLPTCAPESQFRDTRSLHQGRGQVGAAIYKNKMLKMGKMGKNLKQWEKMGIFFLKTKQLAGAGLNAVMREEEIEPHEWKAPVEMGGNNFSLQASLPSIQRELKQLAEDAKERSSSAQPDPAVLGSEQDPPAAEKDDKYPLLMPKGLVLTLKPLGNRFPRRTWRKTTSKNTQSEAVLQTPAMCCCSCRGHIQPGARGFQGPGVQPLAVPAVLAARDGLEFQKVLPPAQPDSRQPFPVATAPALVATEPFQPKLMLPALAGPKARRAGGRKGYQRKKGTKSTPVLKASPVLQPSPVILTVPAATVKVLNIGSGCNVSFAALGASRGRGASRRSRHHHALLVNHAPFPCPLSQPCHLVHPVAAGVTRSCGDPGGLGASLGKPRGNGENGDGRAKRRCQRWRIVRSRGTQNGRFVWRKQGEGAGAGAEHGGRRFLRG
uniref:Uncharacterized protein n=1 Tax=Malurus cyaneus samueli TaxID=2593467 RepID=A0A8C5UB07_9PASS